MGIENRYSQWGKRLLDVTLAAIAALFLSPLFFFIAMLILIDDGRPVFFKHTRIGLGLQKFSLLKFRTLQAHDDAVGEAPRNASPEQLVALRGQFQGTDSSDPRITRVGRILRRTHLDELPQLWNVLCGDMSVIGPRPVTPVQEADYSPAIWRKRHTIRPGITGPAQIEGPYADTLAQREKLDMEYIDNISWSLDSSILARTLGKIFKANSA